MSSEPTENTDGSGASASGGDGTLGHAPARPLPLSTRLERPMTAPARAAMLTIGIAGATGLSVLTGHAMGWSPRASVIMAVPLGVVVGFLFALLLILMPARRFASHLREFARRIERVSKPEREGGFDDLLHLDDDHELTTIARAVHEALSTAHADRLEAARLRRDMEARVEAQTRVNTAQLARLSTTDELTGLINRRGFERLLSLMFAQAFDGGPELALIAIDLDHFKRLNDTHGHDKGDLALKAAGELMKAGIRPEDAAARVGGDELFLLLRSANEQQVLGIAGRLADLFSRHPSAKGLAWPTMSMGVAFAKRHQARSPEHLLQMADAALYAGKRAGRARCVVYDPRTNPVAAAA
ncbi:MAG: GGDEF domain-containing protein [Phycisphaerales bacterium]